MAQNLWLVRLNENPAAGFPFIHTIQVARQDRERASFLTIVCIVNPYEAVRQPTEATCERPSAAGGSSYMEGPLLAESCRPGALSYNDRY